MVKSRKVPFHFDKTHEIKVHDPFEEPILPSSVEHAELVLPWKDAVEKHAYESKAVDQVVNAFKSCNPNLFSKKKPSKSVLTLTEMIRELPPECYPMAECFLKNACPGTTVTFLMQLAAYQEQHSVDDS